MTEPTDAITGLHVFIAEDEFHVLQLIEDMLLDLGCVVADSVSGLEEALDRVAGTKARVAILDVNLRGKAAYPAAKAFRDRGIPVVFSTGYGATGLEPEWRACPVIQKPFASEELAAALAQTASSLRHGVPAVQPAESG